MIFRWWRWMTTVFLGHATSLIPVGIKPGIDATAQACQKAVVAVIPNEQRSPPKKLIRCSETKP